MNMFTEPVQSGRLRRRENTRARIIDTAQQQFVDHGFEGATIRGIAAATGVSLGSVMSVGDKDTLLLISFDRWIGAVHAERATSSLALSDDPIRDVGDIVQPFLDLFSTRAELSREYCAILARGKHDTAVFGELAVMLRNEFEQVAVGAGIGEEAPRAARVLYSSYLGLLLAASAAGDDPTVVRDGLEDIAATVLRAR